MNGNSNMEPHNDSVESSAISTNPTIILLNGSPGVGKHTIANSLTRVIPSTRPHRLFTMDLVAQFNDAIRPPQGIGNILAEQVRDIAYISFEYMRNVKGLVVIMTSALNSGVPDVRIFKRTAKMALMMNARLMVFNIHCDLPVQQQRFLSVESAERRKRIAPTQVENLEMFRRLGLLESRIIEEHNGTLIQLDTTYMEAEDVAKMVWKRVEDA